MNRKILIGIGILVIAVVLISGCIKQAADEKPEISGFIVIPESPVTKEPVSIHLKAIDDKGLETLGFEVKGTPKKEEFNCNGKKICEHTWQLTAPPKKGTFAVIAYAINSKGQRAEQQKIIQIKTSRIPTEKCIPGDGICPSGCTYEQDTDCEEPECSSNADCPSDSCSDKTLINYSCENRKCISSSKSVECCENADCYDQNSSTKDECAEYKCVYVTVTECVSGDEICPSGCTYEKDTDCEKPSGSLEDDIKNADFVVWMCPHADDEVYVPGLLAMSSLDYGKKTSLWVISAGTGNPVENQKVKEFLKLHEYAYVGNNVDIIADKIKKEKPDVIVTFEPTNGFGNPGHADSAQLAQEAIEKSGIDTNLYYALNKDESFLKINPNKILDPGPVSDAINMDTYSDNAGMTYWDIRQEIFKIYSEHETCINKELTCTDDMITMSAQLRGCAFAHFKIFYECPDITKDMKHEEYYRKAKSFGL